MHWLLSTSNDAFAFGTTYLVHHSWISMKTLAQAVILESAC